MKKSKTWLPIFSGYYNSFFDPIDNFIQSETQIGETEYLEYYPDFHNAGITQDFFNANLWECLEYDYNDLFDDLSERICNVIEKLDTQGIVRSISFEKLVSPKEYNFYNDSINCEITYNQTKLMKFLKENKAELKAYLKTRYTSCDGFIPSYPNDIEYWLDIKNHGPHETGSLLNFVYLQLYGPDVELNEVYYNVECPGYNHISVSLEKMIKLFEKAV